MQPAPREARAPLDLTLMIQTCRLQLAAIVLALSSAGAPAAPAPPAAGLPAPIVEALRAHGIPQAAISIVVRDAVSGEVALELNAREPRSPASTMKVVTTFAALDQLGPTYHWTTRAYANGVMTGGRLAGDLVIQGGGDPFISTERWWSFARDLRNTGLRRIDGDIVIDRSFYATQDVDPDEFDGKGYRTYNVLPDALLVNFQAAEFHFLPEASGIRVIVDPEPANLKVENSIKVIPGACRTGLRSVTFSTYADDPDRISLSGRLSSRCAPTAERRAIMRAPDYAYGTFVKFWRELGGEFAGKMRLEPAPREARLLEEFESLTLGEIIRLTNKYSSNSMARMLLLSLAVDRYGTPATVANGERALTEWLGHNGIEAPELVLDNGSGLSRLSRISADTMAKVLSFAYQSRYYPELAASLPLGGQDGTLKHRFAEVAAEARIRLKTGHLNGVGAVAGWVVNRSQRPLTVVVMVNHPGAEYGGGQAVIDTVVRWALER